MNLKRVSQMIMVVLFTAGAVRAGTTYYVDVCCPSPGDGTHAVCGANGPMEISRSVQVVCSTDFSEA